MIDIMRIHVLYVGGSQRYCRRGSKTLDLMVSSVLSRLDEIHGRLDRSDQSANQSMRQPPPNFRIPKDGVYFHCPIKNNERFPSQVICASVAVIMKL